MRMDISRLIRKIHPGPNRKRNLITGAKSEAKRGTQLIGPVPNTHRTKWFSQDQAPIRGGDRHKTLFWTFVSWHWERQISGETSPRHIITQQVRENLRIRDIGTVSRDGARSAPEELGPGAERREILLGQRGAPVGSPPRGLGTPLPRHRHTTATLAPQHPTHATLHSPHQQPTNHATTNQPTVHTLPHCVLRQMTCQLASAGVSKCARCSIRGADRACGACASKYKGSGARDMGGACGWARGAERSGAAYGWAQG